ncbi:Bacteriophage P2 Baseplate assembly protein GPW [Cupriavidus taiwanensis]|uniref:Bacteriophage P2 Baseplate assembly protein GPW n=2 Tax=Cupriavidus taiwanensis TaxID=164546 RepID=A0A375J421_9BURK|nr:Bacteriophage P2 Baseplate assembly protein GPW [Cupriavidus taiwanensis]SPR99549.1 Bacteriophage P2 Baseplate assembly protein GPW [Cupriavidus taiwanensis]
MSYRGMNTATGRTLTDRDHIAQSVRDILTTPIGTRVMRRDYGSLLPELIDQPQHQTTRLRAMSATVSALLRWEPRLRISRVAFETTADGRLFIDIEQQRVDGPRADLQQLRVPLGTGSV